VGRVRAILGALKRHPARVIWSVILLFSGWAVVTAPPPPVETPVQMQARLAAQQAEHAQATLRAERQKSLCNQQTICTKFAVARQECATAGNYKNCVDIKMGKDAMDLYPCMNDGRVWGEPADIPNRFQCFIQSIQ
jgi:hypothetical protein